MMLTAVVVVAVFSLPATLSAAHGNCSYLLTNSSDFIDSNDYMGPDPRKNECFFQIQKPSGLSKDWSVQLSDLGMEKCAECSCGYLRFVNGHVTHDMICDVADVSLEYVYNIFMGNDVSLTFMFRSEGLPTQQHKGFALQYIVTPGRGALCEGDVCQCDDDVIPDFMGCCACNGNHSGNGSEPIPVQKSCSRIYDNNADPDGAISNLQGNSTYVNESECYYTIKMPNISYYHGPWTVNIRFLRLDLEGCGSTCGCGYLEFLNGEVDVRRLCDFSYVDLNHTYSVNVGYDADLKLRYHADPNYGIFGFDLDYEVLVGHDNPCVNDSCDNCYYNQSIDFLGCCRCASYDISTAHIVPPTSPTPTSPTSNCSRIYDNNVKQDGVISNLQDNSTYVNESECYYTIKMPNISYYHGPWTVNIRFLRLDLEGCGSTCGCGYLEFLNGEVDVRRLCDFSYVDLNHTYSVNVGYDTDLKLRYHADPNYGIFGFDLDYEVLVGHANPCVNDSCDNCYYNQSIDFLGCCRCASYDISTAHIVPPTSPTPTSPTSNCSRIYDNNVKQDGVISNLQDNSTYVNESECYYTIKMPNISYYHGPWTVNIRFLRLDLEGCGSTCGCGYLEFLNGEVGVRRLCDFSYVDLNHTYSVNVGYDADLKLRYHADPNYGIFGFDLDYEVLVGHDNPCVNDSCDNCYYNQSIDFLGCCRCASYDISTAHIVPPTSPTPTSPTSNCSRIYDNNVKQDGVISNLQDNSTYVNESECYYTIKMPNISYYHGPWTVNIRFLRLDLEGCGSTCGCGYLEFLNGEVGVRRLCDFSYVDLNHTYSVNVGYDADLKLRYHADPNYGIFGFDLDYEVLVGHDNPCVNDSCDNCYYNQSIDFLGCCRCASYDISTAHIVPPTSPTPTSPTSNCSRIYDNNVKQDGVISNLQDNSTYVNESECYYTIKMPNISYYHGPWTVNIRFLRLDLEGCGSTCGCGYLEFLNGEVGVRRLCDFSYVDLNHTYSVNVGYDADLKLRYHADPNYGIFGFDLDYEVLVGHANPCVNDSCDNCYYNQSIDFLGCCRCASYDISTAHIVPPTSPTPTSPTSNCSRIYDNNVKQDGVISNLQDNSTYVNESECYYTIKMPNISYYHGPWTVNIRFLRLDLEGCGSTCGCGYLEFLNGEVDVRRLCDFSYVDLNHTYSVNVGYDTDLKLYYHADPNYGITGFELDYEVLVGHDNPCANDSCDNCYYNQSIDFLGCCRCASYDISTAHIVPPTSPTPSNRTTALLDLLHGIVNNVIRIEDDLRRVRYDMWKAYYLASSLNITQEDDGGY